MRIVSVAADAADAAASDAMTVKKTEIETLFGVVVWFDWMKWLFRS
jgi:hypothetical protein